MRADVPWGISRIENKSPLRSTSSGAALAVDSRANWLQRNTLTGDWNGSHDQLAEKGVKFDLEFTGHVAQVKVNDRKGPKAEISHTHAASSDIRHIAEVNPG